MSEKNEINKYITHSFENKFSTKEPAFPQQKFEKFMRKYNITLPSLDDSTINELQEPFEEVEIEDSIKKPKISA